MAAKRNLINGGPFFHLFDLETCEARALPGYRAGVPSVGQRAAGWAFVNGHVIMASRHLLTSDGREYLPPGRIPAWTVVERLGPGVFVAQEREAKLWYIEPGGAGSDHKHESQQLGKPAR